MNTNFLNQSFQPLTTLTSKYSSKPNLPASRPIPECLYPPKGASGAKPAPLISTIPDLNFLARKLRSGMVDINGAGLAPDAPFGGYKHSGIGREAGKLGLEEYLEVKVVSGWND